MQHYTVYFIWKLLCMFRVVPSPIIRSANNCFYSIWNLSHRYCYLSLSWKSWNRFECAVDGVRHPQHTQTGSNSYLKPHDLSRRAAWGRLPAEIVGSNPTGAWIFVCCECRVLSGRSLCDELITRPEESYRLWCVVVCDLETSRIGAPYIYIYDISSLRVNVILRVHIVFKRTSTFKFFIP